MLNVELNKKNIEYYKEYEKRPEVIQRRKEYREEHRDQKRKQWGEYSRRPEVIQRRKEYDREYSKRPEEIQHDKEYRRKPEVIQYHKEYMQKYRGEYNKRPEVIEKQKEYQKKPKFVYSYYKRNAEKRKHNFNLTLEQFMQFWQKDCFYCGDKIETAGLDRIDNKKGYEINNIVSCCWPCNNWKSNLSQEEFTNRILKLFKRLSKPIKP